MMMLTDRSWKVLGCAAALLLSGCGGTYSGSEPTARDDDSGGGGPTNQAGKSSSCDLMPLSGWIAFDSDRADFNRDVYRMRPDGSGVERLTDDAAVDEQPSFSADGSSLLFTS